MKPDTEATLESGSDTEVEQQPAAVVCGKLTKPEQQLNEAKIGLSPEEMSNLMNNPELMAAVQNKLHGLMDNKTGYLESLPAPIRGRVNALKNIQVEYAKIEGQFYEEAHELEMKYAKRFKPLYEKRSQVVNGLYEPSEVECHWVDPGTDEDDDDDDEDEEDAEDEEKLIVQKSEAVLMNGDVCEMTVEEKIADDVMQKMKLNEEKEVKGIPDFWYTAMTNVESVQRMIQEHDEPILKHLTDIKLSFTSKLAEDAEMGFVLEFIFSPNEFFSNTSLTKTYVMNSEPEEDDPFSFDGPDIVACTGCNIDWHKGKNVTQKVVKKKQKHKGKGQTRIVQKTIKNDSFFNFFNPPEVPNDEEEDVDEDLQTLLETDFEVGHFFREQLIPKAVLYFTGEAIEEDSDDEDDDYEDDDDDDEDGEDGQDEDEEEEDDHHSHPAAEPEKPPECKQQ